MFTYKDTAINTPNSDTPCSLAWMALRAEPMVLSVPAVDKKRYYSVMLHDGNTFNYGYIGSRATGNDAGDYMVVGPNWKRAAAAKGGIYGNNAVEAMCPLTKTLANGDVLDGSKHKYTLTFPKDQSPPVNAFWSVTMYDGKTQLLINNPIDRYPVNSPMLPSMKKNKDGSLTLYVRKDSPGKDKESNWLPAPNGPIYLVMRLYWPKTEAPSILPPGEGTWQPPGIVKAN